MINITCRIKGHDVKVYSQRKKEHGIFFACKRCAKVVKGKSIKPIKPRPFEEFEKIAYREQEKRIR